GKAAAIADSFRNAMVSLTLGAVAGQLFLLAATPVITRIYTPADFGAFAPFSFWLAAIGAAASFPSSFAVTLAPTAPAAISISKIAMILASFTALVLAGGLNIANWLHWCSIETPYLWLLPAGVLLSAWGNTIKTFAIRTKQFRISAMSDAGRGAAGAAAQIGLGLVYPSMGALAGGLVMGTLASTLISSRARLIKSPFHHLGNSEHAKQLLVKYRHFPIFSMPAAVINTAGMLLPATLLSSSYGPKIGGLFLMSHTLIQAPLGLICRATSQSFMAHVRPHVSRRGDR